MARMVFALGLIALGLHGLIAGDFAAIWQPVPADFPVRPGLVYLCGLICLTAGAGLLWRQTVPPAARLLAAVFALWALVFKGGAILKAPLVAASWESAGETVVLLSAAVLLAGGLRTGRVLYALAMIAFGVAHFAYIKETASLVPSWLPMPVIWVYLTGGAYVAAGVAILANRMAGLAAWLSALQMALLTLLVWVPQIAASGPKQPFQWSETVLSAILAVAGWVVAESYPALYCWGGGGGAGGIGAAGGGGAEPAGGGEAGT